jgi:chorismate mutase
MTQEDKTHGLPADGAGGADAGGATGGSAGEHDVEDWWRGDRVEVLSRIDALREEIDRLDEVLVRLLNARAGCALKIGALKKLLHLEIYQPAREEAVLQHVRGVNPGPLDADAIARLFERIIDEARRLERAVQARERDRKEDQEQGQKQGREQRREQGQEPESGH